MDVVCGFHRTMQENYAPHSPLLPVKLRVLVDVCVGTVVPEEVCVDVMDGDRLSEFVAVVVTVWVLVDVVVGNAVTLGLVVTLGVPLTLSVWLRPREQNHSWPHNTTFPNQKTHAYSICQSYMQ